MIVFNVLVLLLLLLTSSDAYEMITSRKPLMQLSMVNSPLSDKERHAISIKNKIKTVGKFVLSGLLVSNKASAAEIVMPECSDSIIVMSGKHSREVVLIGTAHISEESALLVRRTIRKVKPDLVMIELDRKRVNKAGDLKAFDSKGIELPADQRLALETSATMEVKQRSSVFDQIRSAIIQPISSAAQSAAGAVVGQALSQFYKSVEKLGFTAGGEFMAAAEEGRKIGAKLLLGDRDVDITLQRLAAAIATIDNDKFNSLSDKLSKIESEMGLRIPDTLSPGAEKAQISEIVEGLKQKELVNRLMTAIKEDLPSVYDALIGERDRYMAESIIGSSGTVIVAVVGLAHAAGIEHWLTELGGFKSVKRNCPRI